MDTNELRQFSQTFWVSSCVKTIMDEISSLDWDVVAKDGYEYEWVQEYIAEIKNFLMHPNKNNESFNVIMRAWIKDVLEIDAGVIVKVFDVNSYDFMQIEPKSGAPMLKPLGQRKMTELYVRDGASFLKEIDKFGFNKGYWQYSYQIPAHPMWFNRDEIVYCVEHPRSMSTYGYARTQAILDIIKSLHYSTLYNKRFFEESPIPDGALSLLDTNEVEMKAFLSWWNTEFKAQPHKLAVINKDVKWQPFNVTNRELEFLDTQKWYFNMVISMFGLTPSELGITEGLNRATSATQAELVKRKGIRPFLKLFENYINMGIIPEFQYEGVEFQFIYDDPAEKLARLTNWQMELSMSVKTPNEVREEMGLEPIEGGDVPANQQSRFVTGGQPEGGAEAAGEQQGNEAPVKEENDDTEGGREMAEDGQAQGYSETLSREEAQNKQRLAATDAEVKQRVHNPYSTSNRPVGGFKAAKGVDFPAASAALPKESERFIAQPSAPKVSDQRRNDLGFATHAGTFDANEVRMGIEEEREHSGSLGLVEAELMIIVLDHLKKDPNYYSKLQQDSSKSLKKKENFLKGETQTLNGKEGHWVTSRGKHIFITSEGAALDAGGKPVEGMGEAKPKKPAAEEEKPEKPEEPKKPEEKPAEEERPPFSRLHLPVKPTDKEVKELEGKLLQWSKVSWGEETTEDPKVAGFMLSDGRMTKSGSEGQRGDDHRIAGNFLPEKYKHELEEGTRWTNLTTFMHLTGAIRTQFGGEYAGLSFVKAPSHDQMAKLRHAFESGAASLPLAADYESAMEVGGIPIRSAEFDNFKDFEKFVSDIRAEQEEDANLAPEEKQVIEKFLRKSKGQGAHIDFADEKEFKIIVDKGHYALLSAGRNPSSEEDAKLSDAQLKARNNALEKDLISKGYVFTRTMGKYGGMKEPSFLVMTHNPDEADMVELGTKYNQENIIIVHKLKNKLLYTTGSNKGMWSEAKGYDMLPAGAKDDYTEVTVGKSKLKYSLKLDFDNLRKPYELGKAAHLVFGKAISEADIREIRSRLLIDLADDVYRILVASGMSSRQAAEYAQKIKFRARQKGVDDGQYYREPQQVNQKPRGNIFQPQTPRTHVDPQDFFQEPALPNAWQMRAQPPPNEDMLPSHLGDDYSNPAKDTWRSDKDTIHCPMCGQPTLSYLNALEGDIPDDIRCTQCGARFKSEDLLNAKLMEEMYNTLTANNSVEPVSIPARGTSTVQWEGKSLLTKKAESVNKEFDSNMDVKTFVGFDTSKSWFHAAEFASSPEYAKLLRDYMSDLSPEKRSKLLAILKNGLKSAKDIGVIRRQIESVVKDKNRADIITRTEIVRLANEGNLTRIEDTGVTEEVEFLSAPEDGRLCPICKDLNGKIYTLKAAHGVIPIHPRCRCSFIAQIEL